MGCCDAKNKKQNIEVSSTDFSCPKCLNKGVKVSIVTPQTLLKDCYKSKIKEESIYKFCKNSECEIVYFSVDKTHFFTKEELSVKTTLKDKALDVNVCYCFGHTRQSVLDEIITTGNSTVLDDVKAKMQDPGCFCETSNPQGGCCLGNITAWLKEIQK